MLTPEQLDTITFFVNLTGGSFTWSNVYRLLRDKELKGSNIWPSLYFALASCWSSFFTMSLHAHHAFEGSLVTASGNLTWFLLAYYYTHVVAKRNKYELNLGTNK